MKLEGAGKAFYLLCQGRQLYRKLKCVTGWAWREGREQAERRLKVLREEASPWWEERRLWMKESLRNGAAVLQRLAKELRSGACRRCLVRVVSRPGLGVAVVAGFLLLYGNFYLVQHRLAYAACYNGEEIAVAASRQRAEQTLAEVRRHLEHSLGQPVTLPGTLVFKPCSVSRISVTPQRELSATLERLPWQTGGVEVLVDGHPVLTLANRELVRDVLEKLKLDYLKGLQGESVEQVRIKDRVSFKYRKVAVSRLVSESEALRRLKGEGTSAESYRVKEGDSLWSIARAHNLLVEDLLAANPGVTERLDIGQMIRVSTLKPLISVEMISKVVQVEPIPREVQVRLDRSLRRGSARVISEGSDGERQVVYRLVRVNGRLVSREAISSQVLKPPVSKVVAQGAGSRYTVVYARGSGSGSLSWPVGGGITSSYGYRGGEFHNGIDLGAGYGAAVHAAAGGRVVEAGWEGGYGRSVVINHGNGLSTRYAHLSQIDVHVGESVDRGEVIGNVGATGRATGPHLHFEVHSGGVAVNPLNYLR